jgi:putative ABC transport system substrate-binding protein
MRRRTLVGSALSAFVWPSLASAQKRPFRIAFLSSGTEGTSLSVNELKWLSLGLEEEGLVEGRDFALERRYAEGEYSRFPALVRELLALEPGAIVVSTIASAKAARELTKTVPIVMLGLNNPVGVGLVSSLASPGGNITGVATMNEEVQEKVFQMLREALPSARTVTALLNPGNPSNAGMLAAVRAAATASGIAIQSIGASTRDSLNPAFDELDRHRPDALLVLPDIAIVGLSAEIVTRATAKGVPVIGSFHELTEAGALLSYGRRRQDNVRRAASYLKRIAGGAKPSELPIEQPTKFVLVVSIKAAKALRLDLPNSLVVAADEVIE